MRILNISGKNLASLAGHFMVDFEQEPLASSGLFAISGPTGAGKSTLLDALCLALYDDTPRLAKVLSRSGSALPDVGKETVSAHEKSTLLRRGTADGYAQVDFVGNDGASYRARWSVRRARTKAEGSLQATAMSLHQLPALQAIGGATKTEVKKEIVQRIGLSFDQFTRAVLLAQNEFSTFLKTEDNERGELLETLTGSTIYSDISIRAFERAKKEQAVLQRLQERLADHKPLDTEQRATLEQDSGVAHAALAALEQRKSALEQQRRWHETALQLRQQELNAQLALAASRLEVDGAASRRADLAQLDAVQAARPLADELTRIEADITLTQTAQADSASEAAKAALALSASTAMLQQSAETVRAAEHARRAAAPQLDQAKALDAQIDALQPSHQQAVLTCQQMDTAHAAASSALQEKQNQQRQLRAAHDSGAAWLEQHQRWQTLAQDWPRSDLLLLQAGQAAAQAGALAQASDKARQLTRSCDDEVSLSANHLTTAAQAMQTLALERQHANRVLQAFDADALQRQRQEVEQRREQLVTAEKIWRALTQQTARSLSLQTQATQLQDTRTDAAASLVQEDANAGATSAALVQAERSLKNAEAACAKSVETLRASLHDEAPCPVCGALEHPYAADHGALRAMLASLHAEVTHCRQHNEERIGRAASARAILLTCDERLMAISNELQSLTQDVDHMTRSWNTQTEMLHPPSAAQCDDWFVTHIELVQTSLHTLQQQEQALRLALAAKDQAQLAYEQANAAQVDLTTAATQATARLAQAQAEQTALTERRTALDLQLTALLAKLDSVLRDDDLSGGDWKENWHAAPTLFHAARQSESKQWLTQRAAHDARSASLMTLEVELNALTTAWTKTAGDAQLAHATSTNLNATLSQMAAQRLTLWAGKSVSEIESAFDAALALAHSHLSAQQLAQQQAEHVRARLDEVLAQALRRLVSLRAGADAAALSLTQWLAEAGLEHETLRRLLAVPLTTLRTERAALQALDAKASHAATVLAERQSQSERHRQQDMEQQAEAVSEAVSEASAKAASEAVTEALSAVNNERLHAQTAASALHLALAQDDARRLNAQAMLAELAQQEVSDRRWASMADLIGSADGKKFRNYAQQFTLDVLLGYANAHLHQLARRYQLERIDNRAHPSLGLMVRDQDMGGELRSVHSLSGGESFLVSLALALGLASLSSNRVRVESLFIDEGFGSLDSDTLRVAIDALDGLQSMGRKVGVISHVQEMTERIATRILVQPSAGGKSTVSVQ